MGAYGFVDTSGATLLLRDLTSDEEVRVLNIGAMSARSRGDCLVGRIVPICSAPGLMFESRPVAVDTVTAQAVAVLIRDEEPLGWLTALADARDDGRLPIGFSCTEQTPFTSDLTVLSREEREQPPAPRMSDLMRKGHSADVANAVGVLEVGLISAQVNPNSVGPVVPHVMAAMRVPGAFEAALVECTAPHDALGWEVLAEAVSEQVRLRCLELAARSRAA
jgi:hypothetical protein